MGANRGARLTRVEQGLTPRQAMLLWLEEAHQHGSLRTYVRWLKEQPADAYPLVRLPRLVRQATQDAARGQRRQETDVLVRRAERDVIFLFKLFLEVNTRVLEARKTDALGSLWLLEWLRRCFGATPQQVREEAVTWRQHALALAGEAYALSMMVERLSERYFEGHALLFSDDARGLAEVIESWDGLLGLYMDQLGQLPARQRQALALTPDLAREGGRLLVEHDGAYLVAKAKAETLRLYDDYEAAAVLVEPYL